MTRRLTFLFAVAGGAAVANLYWAQPLLDFIPCDLHASASSAGWLVTATQVGYAAGIALVVPLGDVVNRRRLIPAMMAVAAVALVGCALAPSFGLLLNAAYITGNFVGGAVGSAAASLLWAVGGWSAVSITAVAPSCFALAVWAVGRRGPLIVAVD